MNLVLSDKDSSTLTSGTWVKKVLADREQEVVDSVIFPNCVVPCDYIEMITPSTKVSEHQPWGQSPTVHDLSTERVRRRLIKLINSEYCAKNPADGSPIDPASIKAAAAFVTALPANAALPKVGPDSDGDLMMVWEDGKGLLVAFERWRLHVVASPASGSSLHYSDLRFDGENVPGEILEHIPKRQ